MTTSNTTKFNGVVDALRAKLIEKYEASEKLKAEFPSAEDYAAYTMNTPEAKPLVRGFRNGDQDKKNEAAFKAADAAGRVRIL